MARLRPRRLLIALTAIAVLAPAAGASGAGFTPGTPFPADGTNTWGTLQPGFMGDGTLLAGHTDLLSFSNPVSSKLVLARRPAGGGAWTEEFSLPSTATNVPATPPQMAVAPSGAAIAVWLSLDGPNPATANERVQAAYRAPGGTWEAPATLQTIANGTGGGGDLALAMAPDGKAYVFLGHYRTPVTSPPVEVLDQITHPAGGAWSAPVQVTPNTNSKNPAVGVDDAGAVTIAWSQQFLGNATVTTSDDAYKIVASTRFSSGLASLPADIFPFGPTQSWSRPVLGVGPDGHAVIAAQRQNAPLDVFAAVGKEQNWNPAQQIVTSGATSAPLAAGVSPAGIAYVLYRFQGSNSGLNHIGLLRAAVNGPWSAEQAVSPLGFMGDTGLLAFAGEDAIAAWKPEAGSPVTIGATRWAATSPLADPPSALETTPHDLDAVVPDNLGNVAIFDEDAQAHQTLHAWDATAPALRNAQVPGTATALAPYHASTDTSDLWSALMGPPTWTFDDGSPAVTATSITHVFAAPGAHTITVTVTDAAGNTGTTNFPVNVGQDAIAPTVSITRPTCKKGLSKKACAKLRAKRSAWRTLRGTAADAAPSSGLAPVQVTAYRKTGRRYLAFVGKKLKTVSRATALAALHPVTVTPAGTWSLKLPALPKGTWTFLARAADKAGNPALLPAVRIMKLR